MTKIILIFILFLKISAAYAGGQYSDAKIKNVYYKSSGQIVFEFEELIQEKHFMPLFPVGIKKLRFDYLHWPKDSRYSTWWYKVLPWTESKNDFDKKGFEDCINWMLLNYKNQTSFQFGQMGGGKFEIAEDAKDEVIIPYLRFDKNQDVKEPVCFIDLG